MPPTSDPAEENVPDPLPSFATILETVRHALYRREFAEKTQGGFIAGPIKQNAERLLIWIKTRLKNEPAWLAENVDDGAEIIETCVAVLDYFDDLQNLRNTWLTPANAVFYERLVQNQFPSTKLPGYFRNAVTYLQIEHRRRPSEHRELDQKFELLEPRVQELVDLNTPEAYRLARRYYDLRAQMARQSPGRYEADRFVDLASCCADLEQGADCERPDEIRSEKLISIGLTRIWLQIAKGRYVHAQELLVLVHAYIKLYDNDPLTYAKYLVAKNVCRRALAGKNGTELQKVIAELNEALHIFDQLGDRRHLLRCYHERSLCFLLLGNHDKVRDDLKFMESLARVSGKNPLSGWQVQYCIMQTRLACQHEDYKTAAETGTKAVELALNAGLDLLAIEAKNTLAMVFFRQGKLVQAEGHLQDAMRLNDQSLTQTDHGDLSQPALYGVSLLYLARVSLLKDDMLAAFSHLQLWRRHSATVEHQWVKNLGAEIEQQALHHCLIENVLSETGKVGFARQLQLLRKVSIERASRKCRSRKIVDIAEELDVNRQTIHAWLRDLQKENIMVQLV